MRRLGNPSLINKTLKTPCGGLLSQLAQCATDGRYELARDVFTLINDLEGAGKTELRMKLQSASVAQREAECRMILDDMRDHKLDDPESYDLLLDVYCRTDNARAARALMDELTKRYGQPSPRSIALYLDLLMRLQEDSAYTAYMRHISKAKFKIDGAVIDVCMTHGTEKRSFSDVFAEFVELRRLGAVPFDHTYVMLQKYIQKLMEGDDVANARDYPDADLVGKRYKLPHEDDELYEMRMATLKDRNKAETRIKEFRRSDTMVELKRVLQYLDEAWQEDKERSSSLSPFDAAATKDVLERSFELFPELKEMCPVDGTSAAKQTDSDDELSVSDELNAAESDADDSDECVSDENTWETASSASFDGEAERKIIYEKHRKDGTARFLDY